MKRLLLIIGTAATTITLAAVAHAGNWHHKGHQEHANIAKKLQLTEQQTVEFNSIHQQMHQTKPPLHRYAMQAVMDLDPASADYQAQSEALALAKAEEAKQAILAMAEAHAKVYNLLTPEQREMAKEIRAEMKEKMHERRKNRKEH